MAEVSLRALQNQLDSLARASRFDEAIAHARHILAAQPQNLRAHQQLGAALAGAGQWQPAADVLRRALAAQPGDFHAHWQLARVYQQLDDNDRAIWHAERAIDQRPNDPAVADLIRSLYRQRGQDVRRLQLTASALAQQQIRGNQLSEAIATLDEALKSQPGRIDLQLLRARALWLDGQRMDAAEAAADILDKLPFALEANRILTELWLAERRPSDAAPYLQRIEALDPYLARQLATGEAAPDELVMLPEPAAGAVAPPDAEDALSDEQIDALFRELVIGESIAAASDIPPETAAEPPTDEPADLDAMLSTLDVDEPADDMDGDLANLLAQLDTDDDAEDESQAGEWMAEIQRGDGSETADLEYDSDMDSEWDAEPQDDDAEAGAPWLSAAMRELIDQDEDGAFDLFGDDQGLKSLLDNAGDTQPIDSAAIDDWLDADEDALADDDAAAEDLPELDDETIMSPPGESWLATDDAAAAAEDQNLRNAELIDSWDAELGDDDDDDPYVDWLSEDLLATDATADSDDATQRARAWGLDDPEELANFVEEQSGADTGDLLNVALPGLDRGGDAQPDDPDEFASPVAQDDDFAWLSDIVDEETGAMPAVDPVADTDDALYFRFTQPPAWMQFLLADGASEGSGSPAPSLDEDIDALDLDDLTFDDYFNFDTPTDKLDAISLDQGMGGLDFTGLDWDDYFDLESPTEQTIAITLQDDSEEPVAFDALGVDDDDFDFTAGGRADDMARRGAPLEFDGENADSSRGRGESAL